MVYESYKTKFQKTNTQIKMKGQVKRVRKTIILSTIVMIELLIIDAFLLVDAARKDEYLWMAVNVALIFLIMYLHQRFGGRMIGKLIKRRHDIDKERGSYRLNKILSMMDNNTDGKEVVNFFNDHFLDLPILRAFPAIHILKRRIEIYCMIQAIRRKAEEIGEETKNPEISHEDLIKHTKSMLTLAKEKHQLDTELLSLERELETIHSKN